MWKIVWIWLMISAANINLGNVYGETLVPRGEHSYAVLIRHIVGGSTKKVCGGCVVTMAKVVSTARCFSNDQLKENEAAQYEVTAGTVNLKKSGEGRQDRKVAKIRLHESFRKKNTDDSYYHDIAIAKLEKPFDESNSISLMKLPSTVEMDSKKAWMYYIASSGVCKSLTWGVKNSSQSENNPIEVDVLKSFDLKPWLDADCANTTKEGDEIMSGRGEVCLSQPDVKVPISCNTGSPLACGESVFGIARTVADCTNNDVQHFLLFGPYINHLGLSKSIVLHNFKSTLLCLTSILMPLTF